MRAYSEDLRIRIVAAVEEEGLGKTEVAERFKVGRKTVYRYLERAKQGELRPRKALGGRRKLNSAQMQALQRQLEAHSGDTLMEHAARFAEEHGVELAFSTVNLYCQRLAITRKTRAFMLESGTKPPVSSGWRKLLTLKLKTLYFWMKAARG